MDLDDFGSDDDKTFLWQLSNILGQKLVEVFTWLKQRCVNGSHVHWRYCTNQTDYWYNLTIHD